MNELIFSKWKICANHFRSRDRPSSCTDLLISLAMVRIGRVDQPVLAVAIVADDIENPDMAKRIGEGPEVAGQAADLGYRLLALGDGRGIEGDPHRGSYPGSSSAGVGLNPAMGVFLADVQGLRSARSSRRP